jgi:hypothetical protein
MSHSDILNLYKDYQTKGFTEQQAMALIQSLDINTLDFVTKSELHYEMGEFKAEMRTDFQLLRQEFKGLRWLVIGGGSAIWVTIMVPKIISWFS